MKSNQVKNFDWLQTIRQSDDSIVDAKEDKKKQVTPAPAAFRSYMPKKVYILQQLLNPITPGIISSHLVEDAPTNSKFLDFSQLYPYFHLVK